MQGILFPPLDDEEDSKKDNNGNCKDRVLPQEIEDRFSKVRSLLREKASDDSGEELKRKQEEAALAAARAVQEEVSRLQNGIAELEAMYAMQQRQQQVNQFILDEGEEDYYGSDSEDDGEADEEDAQVGVPANNNVNHNRIVFPALPSMINAVEPDSDADESSSQAGDRGESDQSVVATQDILCDA